MLPKHSIGKTNINYNTKVLKNTVECDLTPLYSYKSFCKKAHSMFKLFYV